MHIDTLHHLSKPLWPSNIQEGACRMKKQVFTMRGTQVLLPTLLKRLYIRESSLRTKARRPFNQAFTFYCRYLRRVDYFSWSLFAKLGSSFNIWDAWTFTRLDTDFHRQSSLSSYPQTYYDCAKIGTPSDRMNLCKSMQHRLIKLGEFA